MRGSPDPAQVLTEGLPLCAMRGEGETCGRGGDSVGDRPQHSGRRPAALYFSGGWVLLLKQNTSNIRGMERYRITSDAAVYYVTYSVVEWLPVFVSEAACKIVTESLNFCHAKKGLRINAFVIMPTHLHAIVFNDEFRSDPLAAALTDFRKFTGRNLSDYCQQSMPSCFAQTLRDQSTADRERRFWQPSRHPVALLTEKFWQQKLGYLHENPVRKGLVRQARDWRFSSAAWYDSDARFAVDVQLTGIDWS